MMTAGEKKCYVMILVISGGKRKRRDDTPAVKFPLRAKHPKVHQRGVTVDFRAPSAGAEIAVLMHGVYQVG